jgi:hypothetical protein
MPHATKRRHAIYDNGTKDYARFVHYTSAEAALKIIKSKRVWMRNTTCMSDYREVQYGYDILNRVFLANGNRGAFAAVTGLVKSLMRRSLTIHNLILSTSSCVRRSFVRS